MTGLIDYIARELVDHPEAVDVKEVPDGADATLIELRVASDDLGKVIGRQGRTARAIRTLLAAAASKQQRRVSLEIIE
jgi:predicted RNA-binding protein YlqC (UPF0109 family)